MRPDLTSAGKLPARANLEHLKNEAKQRLKTHALAQNPAARPEPRLAQAQLLVARSYGFPSWRKLKAHVDALHDYGQQLINAMHAGELERYEEYLDQQPELVNAATDLPRRDRPGDTQAWDCSTWRLRKQGRRVAAPDCTRSGPQCAQRRRPTAVARLL